MGLKVYRLWVMGQLDSNVQSLTSTPPGQRALLPRAYGWIPLFITTLLACVKTRFK
jgi:hypothetical protein